MDIANIPAEFVALAVPYLTTMAEGAATKTGELAVSGIGRAWGFMKDKLSSPAAQEAIADFEGDPADEDFQAAFRVQLKKAIKDDPELLGIISKALPATTTITQTGTVTGSGTVINISGDKNIIR